MKTILAFGASNSKNSINKQFAWNTAKQIDDVKLVLADLNDYELPMYGVDYEEKFGLPDNAKAFTKLIEDADGIVISFAEYNGNYTSVYKNLFDWISRTNYDVWKNKPMFLLATSPGGRGAAKVLEIATDCFSRFSGEDIFEFSLPFYGDYFDVEKGITNEEFNEAFDVQLELFKAKI